MHLLCSTLQKIASPPVDFHFSRQELSMPPTITLEQMKGFTLFTLKVVLSGRGDEIVDLAKTSLVLARTNRPRLGK
jgi:hypothetical protein